MKKTVSFNILCFALFSFLFSVSVTALGNSDGESLSSNYLEQLPLLLLYAFLIYCLPVIVYRFVIRRYAMMVQKARWFAVVYMLCAFLVSIVIQSTLFAEDSAKHIPILWGFVDYAILTCVTSKDIKKVNVRGFSTKLSYTDGEKEQVFSQVSIKVLQQCHNLRTQKKALKKYLNMLICDGEIDNNQASVLYQDHMKAVAGQNSEEATEICSQAQRPEENAQKTTRKRRKGWGWSVAALVAWFPLVFISFINTVIFTNDVESVGIGAPLSVVLVVVGLALHFIFYMNPRRIDPKDGLVVAWCNLVIVSLAFLFQIFSGTGTPPMLIITPSVPLFICYLLHIFKSYCNTPVANRPSSTQTIIRNKKKAYEQIAKFYEYKEKGIMTEEEFERSKTQILSTIEEQ